MAIKVSGTKVSGSEISSEITFEFPEGLSREQKRAIKDQAGEIIVDHILGRVSQAKSPISGGRWPALSSGYKKFKQAEGAGSKANMEFSGDMLDRLGFKRTENGVKIQITGKEARKADGHNNFSGRSNLPQRKFLPEEGDSFGSTVKREIDSLIADQVAKSRNIRKSDIPGITTKSALNAFIRKEFIGVSLSQAKNAILFDDVLRDIFGDVLELF